MFKFFKNNKIFKCKASTMLVFSILFSMITGLLIYPTTNIQAAEKNWIKFSSLSSLTEENGELTNNTGNLTLSTGYYIADKNTTITGVTASDSVSATSAIVISGTVELYIPKGITLSVKGGDGYYEKAGAAGIELNSGNTLRVFGEGKLIATGGNAGNGRKGGAGGAGGNSTRKVTTSSGTSVNFYNALCWGDYLFAGAGGAGGNGGGGAGAGIGTIGGAGGAGAKTTGNLNHKFMTYTSGTATDLAWNDLRSKNAINGTNGSIGNDGAAFGVLYKDSVVSITATGGSDGTLGGEAGSYGNTLFSRAEISSYVYHVGCYGGGGGAGGGAGFAAYGIGTGGTGGNGGNSGASGNIDVAIKDVVNWGSGCKNANLSGHARTYGAYGQGGAGGKGSVNGSSGSVITYTRSNCTCSGGAWSKNGGTCGSAPAATNRSVEKVALTYTPDNIGFVDDDNSNFSVESLNNLVDSNGDLIKHVSGNGSSDLKVELATENQAIVAYKLADVTWDNEISTYSYPLWVNAVEEWINSESRPSEIKNNLSSFASSVNLSTVSSHLQDMFFRAIAADTALLESLDSFDEPTYSSEDSQDEEAQDGSTITKHYALFENLAFGTYIIVAPGYSPVVINIIPERSATGFVVPLLFKTTLKGGGIDVDKMINGRDVDTVSVGETVDFEISFTRPTDITADSSIVLTDTMSNAFLLKQVTSIVVSTDEAGTQLLTAGTDYSIGTTSTNADGSINIPITFAADKLIAISAEKIYVKYSAIVTENVKYNSEGNYNSVLLQVDHLKSEDTVRAYTYGLNIVKLDGTSAENIEDMGHLSGVQFNLFKEKYIYIDDAFKGAFDDKAGMNYTTTGIDAPADGFIDDCLANSALYYVHKEEAEADGSITVDGEAVTYVKGASIIRIYELVTDGVGFSDDKGTITSAASEDGVTIGGLDSGSYILVETHPLAGYQRLAEDVYFEINRLTEDEANLKTSGSLSSFYEMGEALQLNESGKVKINVINYKGLTLPSTGGTGILLFTIIGIVMMLSVIIIIIVKKHAKPASYFM